jgi:hypothetical protein
MNNFIANAEEVALGVDELLAITRNKTNVILYENLVKVGSIFDILIDNTCIIHFPIDSRLSGHYTCIIYHKDTDVLESFDSYGLPIEFEVSVSPYLQRHPNMRDYLTHLLQLSGKQIEYNTTRFQQMKSGLNTCGRWAAMRIRLKHLTLDEFTKHMTQGNISHDTLVTLLTVMFSENAESLFQ